MSVGLGSCLGEWGGVVERIDRDRVIIRELQILDTDVALNPVVRTLAFDAE